MRIVCRCIYILVFCLLLVLASNRLEALGQVITPSIQQGTPVNTSNDEHGIESVNTMGLGLHIEIPLLSLQEHGRTLSWKYVYNSPTYSTYYYANPGPNGITTGNFAIQAPGSNFKPSASDNWQIVASINWQLLFDAISFDSAGNPLGCGGDGTPDTYQAEYIHYVNFRLLDPEGTAHPLAMEAFQYTKTTPVTAEGDGPSVSACPGAYGDSISSPTLDGSGAYVDLAQNAFWLKDGTKFNLQPQPPVGPGIPNGFRYGGTPQVISVEDRNGNYLFPPNGAFLADALGRGLTVVSNNASVVIYQYIDSNGTPQNITVNFTRVPVTTNDCDLTIGGTYSCVEYVDDASTGFRLPSSIVLPNGATYTFTYNSPGTHAELSSITLPTGAEIDYTYQRIYSGLATPRQGVIPFKYAVKTRTELVSGKSAKWQYSFLYYSDDGSTSVVQDPNGNCTEHVYANLTAGDPVLEQTVTYKQGCGSTAQILKTVQTDYSGDNGGPAWAVKYWNPRPTKITTTIANGQSSRIETDYDSYVWNSRTLSWVDPVEIREFDFNQSAPTRTTDYKYLHQVGSSAHPASDYASRYVLDRIANVIVSDSSGKLRTTEYDYDAAVSSSSAVGRDSAYGNWGNATNQTITDNINGHVYTSSYIYEDTGNMIQASDPKGNLTYYSYADNWANTSCGVPNGGQGHVYLTQVTNALNQSAHYAYNSCSGTNASITDANNQVTSMQYDFLGRTTQVSFPDGGKTSFSYQDSPPTSMTASQLLNSTNSKSVTTLYDGLGRTTQTQLMSDPAGTDYVDTVYDALGLVQSVSNPHRSDPSPTDGTTTFTYDALGRKIIQTQPDGSLVQWCYDGIASGQASYVCLPNQSSKTAASWVDYSDEANRHAQRVSDALGRMTAVMEPVANFPTLETDYSYDALNNLISVNQKGTSGETPRVRTFVYDSLSRLTSSTNPETGTIGYGYDPNGNMTSKTDARGITTNYVYDALNRLTNKSSSGGNGVPGFNYIYGYDVVTPVTEPNGIGRLLFTATDPGVAGGVAEQYFYDSMGRMTSQATYLPSAPSTPQYTSATYDLAGNVTSLTYPDGLVVNPTWNSAGQLTQVANSNGYQYLIPNSAYWPNGAPEVLWYGNGVANGYRLNNRLQIQENGYTRQASTAPGTYSANLTLSVKVNCYGPATAALSGSIPGCPALSGSANNNGSIWQIMDPINPGKTQNFTYDSLNRLTSFSQADGSLQQTYSIDSFGNLNQTSPGTLQSNLGFNALNQIDSGGYGYDAAGNISTVFNGVGYNAYGYDAANNLVNVNYGAATYTYDANGDRVRKDVSPNWTEYVRFNGQTLAEKNADGTWSDYIYANGQRIARDDSYDIRIHMSGTNCSGSGCNTNYLAATTLHTADGTPIANGDVLAWRQYQDGSAIGGILLYFGSDGTGNQILKDTDGQFIDTDTISNRWHERVVDLSSFAGKTLATVHPWMTTGSGPGAWNMYFGDIVLVHANGTSIPIYSRSMTTLPLSANTGVTGLSIVTEKVPDPARYASQTYYSNNQIGSTQTLTTYAGWPVSSDTYYPFGQEATPTADNNHYKFTGKERDAESGLDYFGARYYGSTMGRWMSPDWADKPEAVPYSDLGNPQSLNLYGYVNNNPLSKADPDGHCPQCLAWGEQVLTEAEESPAGQAVLGWLGAAAVTTGAVLTNAGGRLADAVASGQTSIVGNGWEIGQYPTAHSVYSKGDASAPSGAPNASPSGQTNSPSGPEGPYKNSPENNDRMKAGKAPIGNDGKPVELHHEGQDPKGPVKEMTQTDHRGGDNFKNNHPNTGQEPSKIDRNQAAQARRQHWKDKADQ